MLNKYALLRIFILILSIFLPIAWLTILIYSKRFNGFNPFSEAEFEIQIMVMIILGGLTALTFLLFRDFDPVHAWSIFFEVKSGSLVCRLNGKHDFNEWKYTSDASCTQIRTCKRDNYQEERIIHEWGKWEYTTDDSCAQVRTCKRDSYQEERIMHQWGEWEYQSSGKERFCLRCKEREYESDPEPTTYSQDDYSDIGNSDWYKRSPY